MLKTKANTQQDVKRGSVYFANLDPGFGSEQGGSRPVLVIQNNAGNRYSPTVIVAAITSKQKKIIPTHVKLPAEHGLEKDSVILLEQLRTIDKRRLVKKVAELDEKLMNHVDMVLKVSLGINNDHGIKGGVKEWNL